MLIIEHGGKVPKIASSVFLAPNATLIGEVIIQDEASIWFGAVLRSEGEPIIIGPRSNIQDGCIIHVSPGNPTILCEEVTVGHAVVLHGCRLEKGAVIGSRSVVLDGAVVGAHALVAAGSVITHGMVIPAGHLAAGVPAVDKGPLPPKLLEYVKIGAEEYVKLAAEYLREFAELSPLNK